MRWITRALLLLAVISASMADATPSRFWLLHQKHGVVAPPPVSGATYDTSIGLSVDSTGRANLTPRTGATVYYVNSTTGNDANTCLQAQSPSTPRATIKQGEACVTDGNGDFLLIAQGMSYPNGFAYVGDKGGFSPQYPVVYESYDPADPTNQTKWGTAVGTNRPDINMATGADNSGGFIQGGGTSKKYRAFRGLNFDGEGAANVGVNIIPNTTGSEDYLLFENDVFPQTALSVQGNANGLVRTVIVRNCALYGEWGASRTQGLYASYVDGLTVEDSVFWHNGWEVGASRSADPSVGGASSQSHAMYLQDTLVNTVVRRNVTIDSSSEAANLKGGGLFQYNLSIRNPIFAAAGSGNNYTVDAPYGVYVDFALNAAIGGGCITGNCDMNWGLHISDGRQGQASIRDNVLARSGFTTTGYALMDEAPQDHASDYTYALPAYQTFSGNVSYLWNPSGSSYANGISGSADKTLIHTTLTSNIWDDPTSGSNVNNGGVTFPNAYTEAALLTALGYPDETTAINDWIANPQNHAWRTGPSLMTGGYGIASPSLSDLTTSMSITAGIATSGQFINTLDGSTLTATGLPACVTLDTNVRAWRATSSCTVGSGTASVTETNGTNVHTTSIPWAVYAQPVLSSLTVTPGSTTASLSVSTNTGNGNLYWMVDPTSTTRAWPEVRIGAVEETTDPGTLAFEHGSQAISATGAQSVSLTGLAASTTYTAYAAQLDGNGAGNPSAVLTYTFTTTSSWTPASLGSNLVLDLTELDSSHLFTDTGCTTALTTDGQTAKCIKDTTTGIKFTNSTGWVYHANSGKPYLAIDGSSSFVSTTAITFADAAGQYAMWATGQFSGSPVANGYIVWVSGGAALLNPNPSTNANNFNIRSSSAQLAGAWSKPVSANTDAVFSGISTGTTGTSGTVEAFVNNVDTPGSGSQPWSGTPLTSATLSISVGGASAGKFYGLLIAKGNQTSNQASAQTYMAALHP